jgi:hypothetical protein
MYSAVYVNGEGKLSYVAPEVAESTTKESYTFYTQNVCFSAASQVGVNRRLIHRRSGFCS